MFSIPAPLCGQYIILWYIVSQQEKINSMMTMMIYALTSMAVYLNHHWSFGMGG